jgi:hypothetical protein
MDTQRTTPYISPYGTTRGDGQIFSPPDQSPDNPNLLSTPNIDQGNYSSIDPLPHGQSPLIFSDQFNQELQGISPSNYPGTLFPRTGKGHQGIIIQNKENSNSLIMRTLHRLIQTIYLTD